MPRRLTSTSRRGPAGKWLALTTLSAVLGACGGDDSDGTSVQDFMESAGQVRAITVSDIYDRDVSDVVIVCAYTGASTITDELGFDWPGATSLASQVDTSDSHQAVIAVHNGEVVESEVMLIDVLHVCDMDLSYPATIDAGTTLTVSWSSTHWSDGTTKTVPVASID